MKTVANSKLFLGCLLSLLLFSCNNQSPADQESTRMPERRELSAKELLGNPAYPAICFGGYRERSRDVQPTVAELKEDMRLLHALGIRVVRTYHTGLPHASNVVEAIHQLKGEDSAFEMYVMLGAWINCKDAFTEAPDHFAEDEATNATEIERAVALAQKYPDIVKILAVGNEAMVKWQALYHVQAGVILKWVNYLQGLKQAGQLSADLWITSSDNFASWGGGGSEYHTEDLEKLIRAVDYISMHTYPMHDTHYNPDFWGVTPEEAKLPKRQQLEAAMLRAREYAVSQYRQVRAYIEGLGLEKPVHIGETGWATASNSFYGPEGSHATDEYKSAMYHELMREWSRSEGVSLFYFEAFDEIWKDAENPGGSENHFGLFTVDGKAKYVLWDQVDQRTFEGLGRNGQAVEKTYGGNEEALLEEVLLPPVKEW